MRINEGNIMAPEDDSVAQRSYTAGKRLSSNPSDNPESQVPPWDPWQGGKSDT